MKKVFLAICAGVIGLVSYGQQGTTKIGIGAEVGIPTGDFDAFKTGFGGYAKGLFGIGTAGQITFTSGYTTYEAKGSTSSDKITYNIIPLLAGYRHNFSGFYVEPQVGYGIYGAKVKSGGISASSSDGAFTWAAGVGYVINDAIELGARYQSGHKDGSSTSLVGLRIGY
ncbi:MAG: outer membrane beta-barrel protein, partial [Chitinophagaceae bacterium]